MSSSDWLALATWVVGALVVAIVSLIGLWVRSVIGAFARRMGKVDETLSAFAQWKEDTRVTLGRDFVLESDMLKAIDNAVKPLRVQQRQTHEIVVKIAESMHIPTTPPRED